MRDVRNKHLGERLFLVFALAFSLLGTSGPQAIAQAFAEEAPQDAPAEAVAENDGNVPASSAEDSDANAPVPGAEESDESVSTPGIARLLSDTLQAALLDSSPLTPKEHYAYEYVYGVFEGDYAVFSDEPFGHVENEYGDYVWNHLGVLVSRVAGRVLDEGKHVGVGSGYSGVNKETSFVPFEENGKWGLWDIAGARVAVPARYDSAGFGYGPKWGFIDKGDASNGYAGAKAVIYNGADEVLSVPLEGYDGGSAWVFSETSYAEEFDGCWGINWSSAGGYRHQYWREEADGFRLTWSDDYDDWGETFDGREVRFSSSAEGITIRVQNTDGSWGEPIALATDATSSWNCSVVSNVIEIRGSNGHEYQYFTLGGELLQSMDDQRLQGIGNYVAYERVDFATQENTYVFLDTSNANTDARDIPCLQGGVREVYDEYSGHYKATGFDCLTKENKIQLYDTDLKLVKEFTPSLNLAESKTEGMRVSWELVDFGEDTWMLSQATGWRYAGDVERVSDFYQGDKALSRESLGLASPDVQSYGTIDDYIYLLDESGTNKLQIYNKGLVPAKTIDLSSRITPGFKLSKVSFRHCGYGDSLPWVSCSLHQERDFESSCSYIVMDESFELTDLSAVNYAFGSNYIAVNKDGKYGFVDSNLTPLGEFVYDNIHGFWNGDSDNYVIVEQNDKQRLLDANLKDVVGYSFDGISTLAADVDRESRDDVYVIRENGNSRVYDKQFREIDLKGYRTIDRSEYYDSMRTLPNGNVLIYVQDAEGRVGAIDNAGNILVPARYKGFAEFAGGRGSSNCFLLRDDEGWFFVSAAELTGVTNPECAANGHDYEEMVYAPTCEENGYTQQVCKRCGDAYRVSGSDVPKLGHDFVKTAEATQPTCTDDGLGIEYTCTRCGKVQRDPGEPKLGGDHEFETEILTEATCTTAGLKHRHCNRCGLDEQVEYGPYGHSWRDPVWEWSSDFQQATAYSTCGRCRETSPFAAEVTHDSVEGGNRHSAYVEIAGITYKDGRLVLGWVDGNGVSRSLLVRGAPVVDGFNVKPQGLNLPADASIAIDVADVKQGGVFDALVEKMGGGWPGGTYEVKLNVNDEELHDGFGSLAFSFPAGDGSANKRATIRHCHKNDRSNITAHEVVVSADGIAFLDGITDLSTFAIEVFEDEVPQTGNSQIYSAGTTPVTNLATTGDSAALGLVAAVAAASLALALFAAARRKRSLRD